MTNSSSKHDSQFRLIITTYTKQHKMISGTIILFFLPETFAKCFPRVSLFPSNTFFKMSFVKVPEELSPNFASNIKRI